jgi:fucose permease
MAALTPASIGALLQHEQPRSGASVQSPGKAVVHDKVVAPTNIELDAIQWGQPLPRPSGSGPAGDSIPPTPGELERSQPPTPKREDAVDALAALSPRTPRNRWRLAASAIIFATMGATDAVTGAVLPSIEHQYQVTYSVVSLLFIAYAMGFIMAAPVISAIDSKIGRSRMLMTACTLMSVGYIILICAPPFPVVVIAFWFTGTGIALFLSTANSWIANLMNGTIMLGIMHGIYGVGGIVSPLIATAMISRGIRWSYFYLIPLTLSVLSIGFTGWSYRGFEADASHQLLTALERTASRRAAAEGQTTRRQLLWQSAKNRTTLLGALFIL